MSRKDVWVNTSEELREALVCVPMEVRVNPQLPYFVHFEPPSLSAAGRTPMAVALGDVLSFAGTNLCFVGDSLDNGGRKEQRRPALVIVLEHTACASPPTTGAVAGNDNTTARRSSAAQLSFALTFEFLELRFEFSTPTTTQQSPASHPLVSACPLLVDAAASRAVAGSPVPGAVLTLQKCVVTSLPCEWLCVQRGQLVCIDTVVQLRRGLMSSSGPERPQGNAARGGAACLPSTTTASMPPTCAILADHPQAVVRCENAVWDASARRIRGGPDAAFFASLGCVFYAMRGAQLSFGGAQTLLDASGCAAAVVVHGVATRCAMTAGPRVVVGSDGGVVVVAGAMLTMHTVDVAAAIEPPPNVTEDAIHRLRRVLLPAWYGTDDVAGLAGNGVLSDHQEVVDTRAISVVGEGSTAELQLCAFFKEVANNSNEDDEGCAPMLAPLHALHATGGGSIVCAQCTATTWGAAHCVSLVAGGHCTSTACTWRHVAAPGFGAACYDPRAATSSVIALVTGATFTSTRDCIVGSRQCGAVVDARDNCALSFLNAKIVACQWIGIRAMNHGCSIAMRDSCIAAGPRMCVPEDPQEAYLVGTLPTTVGLQLLSVRVVECVGLSVSNFEIGCMLGALPVAVPLTAQTDDPQPAQVAPMVPPHGDAANVSCASCLFQGCRVWGSDRSHLVHCAFALQDPAHVTIVDGCTTTSMPAPAAQEGEKRDVVCLPPSTFVNSFVRADSGCRVDVTGPLVAAVQSPLVRVRGALFSVGGNNGSSGAVCPHTIIVPCVTVRNFIGEGAAGLYAHWGARIKAENVYLLCASPQQDDALLRDDGCMNSAGVLAAPGATVACHDVCVHGFECGFASSFLTAPTTGSDGIDASMDPSLAAGADMASLRLRCAPIAEDASCVVALCCCVALQCQTSFLFGSGSVSMERCIAQSVGGADLGGVDLCASGQSATVRFVEGGGSSGTPAIKHILPPVVEAWADLHATVDSAGARPMTAACLLTM